MGRRHKTDSTNDEGQKPGTSHQVKGHGPNKLRTNNFKRSGIERNGGNSKEKRTNVKIKPGTSKLKSNLGTRKDVPNNFIKKRVTRNNRVGKKMGANFVAVGSIRVTNKTGSRNKNIGNNKSTKSTRKKCIGNSRVGHISESSKTSAKKATSVTREKLSKNNIKNNNKSDDALMIGRNSGSRSRIKRKFSGTPIGSSENDEKPCKRSRMQSPATMTTRSMRAKKVGVTRFIFDKVCDCSENKHFNIFTDGGLIRGCPCGKRYEQFLKLTGGFDKQPGDGTDVKKKSRRCVDYFSVLSLEMICHVFQYLTLREVLRFESLSRKLQKAVHAALAVREEIDFNEEIGDRCLFNDNLDTMTNKMFSCLLKKLPRVRNIYNFHPANVSSISSSNSDILTTTGVCNALKECKFLEGIEISNMDLLESIVSSNAHPKIIGKFANRNQEFPVLHGGTTVLKEESRITNLHLVGCSLYYMPQMDNYLEHLYLR